MADYFKSVRNNVRIFFGSLSATVERSLRQSKIKTEDERELTTKILTLIEEARIRFNTYRFDDDISASVHDTKARLELVYFLDTFIQSDFMNQRILKAPFRIISGYVLPGPTDHSFRDRFFVNRNPVSLLQAIDIFKEYIENNTLADGANQIELPFMQLGQIVPQQKVAPAQFNIVDNKVFISKKSPTYLERDASNITHALDHISQSGKNLIAELEFSNCDRRLLEKVRNLHDQIAKNDNIVKIGLSNFECSIMGVQFRNELPDAIFAMLTAYNTTVAQYTAQFPDWVQFSQNAATSGLDDADVRELSKTAEKLIDILNQSPSLADPEVPKTIRLVKEFITSPESSTKRAAFAMLRTIENLVSSIVHHTLLFTAKTGEKLAEKGSAVASSAIIGLLGIALVGASGIGSTAIRAGAPWLQQAAEVVQKQIERANQ